MEAVQPGILAPVPRLARYLTFILKAETRPWEELQRLAKLCDGKSAVVGIGGSLVEAVGRKIEGLRGFPPYTGPGFTVPSTSGSLWIWLRGGDRGELVHRTRELRHAIGGSFDLDQIIDAFQYQSGLDLSGYEDGTENPQGQKAKDVAIVAGGGKGMEGSSFVAVQQWVHDLDHLDTMSESRQDAVIGRRKQGNEEIDDAPASAHVKRTAQESFNPHAFVVRRSMPWADAGQAGLVFVAFGRSFDAFDALLRRMVGAEDGITDALFSFTRPITGTYFWCPPIEGKGLDLSALRP